MASDRIAADDGDGLIVNRRFFFNHASAAAAFLSGFVAFQGWGRPAGASGPVDVRTLLLEALPNRAHAARIGNLLLAEGDGRPDSERLPAEIMSCIDMTAADIRRCKAVELKAFLRARTASDFAAGRTIRAGGWVLGATEARLFSLAAIA